MQISEEPPILPIFLFARQHLQIAELVTLGAQLFHLVCPKGFVLLPPTRLSMKWVIIWAAATTEPLRETMIKTFMHLATVFLTPGITQLWR